MDGTIWFQSSGRNGIFHISRTLSLVCHLTNWAITTLGMVTNAGHTISILLWSFLSPQLGDRKILFLQLGIINKGTIKHTACHSVVWNRKRNKGRRKWKTRKGSTEIMWSEQLLNNDNTDLKDEMSSSSRSRGQCVSGREKSCAKMLQLERGRHV